MGRLIAVRPLWAIEGGRVSLEGDGLPVDPDLPVVRVGGVPARLAKASTTALTLIVPEGLEGGQTAIRIDQLAGETAYVEIGAPLATGLHQVDSPAYDRHGNLFVTFALQDAAKHDDQKGPGRGFVDVFDTDGHLVKRFASRGALNSPWGIARAPLNFGPLSTRILIGNFGDGRISGFTSGGDFRGQLRDPAGRAVRIDGLWSIQFGVASAADPGASGGGSRSTPSSSARSPTRTGGPARTSDQCSTSASTTRWPSARSSSGGRSRLIDGRRPPAIHLRYR